MVTKDRRPLSPARPLGCQGASILLLTTCRSVRYENVSAVQSLATGIIPLKPDKGEYGCLLIRPLLNRPSHPVNRCSRGSCVRISGPRSAAPRRWREYAPSEPMGPCSGTTKRLPVRQPGNPQELVRTLVDALRSDVSLQVAGSNPAR